MVRIRTLLVCATVGLICHSFSNAQQRAVEVASEEVQFMGSTLTVKPGENHARTYSRMFDLPINESGEPEWMSDPFGSFIRSGGVGDWSNHGGNSKKNGLSPVLGPIDGASTTSS